MSHLCDISHGPCAKGRHFTFCHSLISTSLLLFHFSTSPTFLLHFHQNFITMNGQPPQQPQGYYGDKPANGGPNGMPEHNGMPQQNGHQHPHPHGPAKAYEHAGKLPSKFQFGLFDCFSPFSTCCLSCWCPCILFQKTYARERGETDPSGMGPMVSTPLHPTRAREQAY
jgi:hypothetical protein